MVCFLHLLLRRKPRQRQNQRQAKSFAQVAVLFLVMQRNPGLEISDKVYLVHAARVDQMMEMTILKVTMKMREHRKVALTT